MRGAEREGQGETSGFQSQFVCSTLMMWRGRIMVRDAAQHPVCNQAARYGWCTTGRSAAAGRALGKSWWNLTHPVTSSHHISTLLLHICLMLARSHPSHLSRNRLSWSSCVVGSFGSGTSSTVLGNTLSLLHAIRTLPNRAFLWLMGMVRITSHPISPSSLCLTSCLDTGQALQVLQQIPCAWGWIIHPTTVQEEPLEDSQLSCSLVCEWSTEDQESSSKSSSQNENTV